MYKLAHLTAALCKEAGIDPLVATPFVLPAIEAIQTASSAPNGEGARAGILAGTGSLAGEAAGAFGGGALAKALHNRGLISSTNPKLQPLMAAASLILGTLGGGALGASLGGAAGRQIAKSTSDNPYYRHS